MEGRRPRKAKDRGPSGSGPASHSTTTTSNRDGVTRRSSNRRATRSIIDDPLIINPDVSMSEAGTETTIAFPLSLGGASEKGGPKSDGVGANAAKDSSTDGKEEVTAVQVQELRREGVFSGIHLLFVGEVWNTVESQLLSNFAASRGCTIHTDLSKASPTWLLVIPIGQEEEPRDSGSGMRLAFGLGRDWKSLELLPRVTSQWIKQCVLHNRVIDREQYGIKSFIDPDQYPKAHPQRNWVSPNDTDVWCRLMRILEQMDVYFDRMSTGSSSLPRPTRSGFYAHQDDVDAQEGKKFKSSIRSFMSPYLLMLEHVCPAFVQTSKKAARKPRSQQPRLNTSAMSPAPEATSAPISRHTPGPHGTGSLPTSDLTGPSVGHDLDDTVTTPSSPTIDPTSRTEITLPTSLSTTSRHHPPPSPLSNVSDNDPRGHEVVDAVGALLDLGGGEGRSRGSSTVADDFDYSKDDGIYIPTDIDLDHDITSPGGLYQSPPTTPKAKSRTVASASPESSLTPVPRSAPLPGSSPERALVPITEPASPQRSVSTSKATGAKRKLDDRDDPNPEPRVRHPPPSAPGSGTKEHSTKAESVTARRVASSVHADDNVEKVQIRPDRNTGNDVDGGREPDDEPLITIRHWLHQPDTWPPYNDPRLPSFGDISSILRMALLEPDTPADDELETTDRQFAILVNAILYIIARDTPAKGHFVTVGSEFLSSYYDNCMNDVKLDHNDALGLSKDYYGGLHVEEDDDQTNLFILLPFPYGNVWTAIIGDVHRQKTLCVYTTSQPPDGLRDAVEELMRLLLMNMVCSVSNREYSASSSDYVVCPLGQNQDLEGETLKVMDESPCLQICKLSTAFRRLVEVDPILWQRDTDPSILSASLFPKPLGLTSPSFDWNTSANDRQIRRQFRNLLYMVGVNHIC